MPCDLVPKSNERQEVLDDGVADLLARPPRGLAPVAIRLRREDRVDIAHGDLAAVDRGTVVVVRLLHLRIECHDLREQPRLDLILEIAVVELVNLADQSRVAEVPGLPQRLDAGEIVRVAVDPPNLQLKLPIFLEFLRRARRGGLPVRKIRPPRQRLDLCCMTLDESTGFGPLIVAGTTHTTEQGKHREPYGRELPHVTSPTDSPATMAPTAMTTRAYPCPAPAGAFRLRRAVVAGAGQ